MSRGSVPDDVLASIQARVPMWSDVRGQALSLQPDFLAASFAPDDYTPVASVCFHDCTNTIAEIRYALLEYFAHGEYYRHYSPQPNAATAEFFERYYLDDAAFRLYAAAEHLASAVLFMLNLKDLELEPYKKKNRVSLQSITVAYLRARREDWSLTARLVDFGTSPSWRFAMDYRNRLVHEQPPILAGEVIAYRRRLPWKVSADGTKRLLEFGGGDPPEFSTSEVRDHLLVAYGALLDVVRDSLDAYFEILEVHKIVRRDGTIVQSLGR